MKRSLVTRGRLRPAPLTGDAGGWRATAGATGLAIAMAILAPQAAQAVDVNSSDYVPAPAGTNLLLFYSTYTTSSQYTTTSGQTLSNNTGIDTYVDILRYVHYFDIGGFRADIQVLLPAGTAYNARLNGSELSSAAGLADPILVSTLWLYNDKTTQSYFGITPFLYLPLGQYDENDALNMGENRWKLDLQAGYYQGFANGFAFQIAGDVMWYGNNSDAGTGTQTLSQDNTYQFQLWLSYAFAETWSAAAGYSRYWGGSQYLDGVATGAATQKDQLRFELSKFITPTFQVMGMVQRDFNTSGGFEEDFRGTVRLMQVF
ncbi:transporter [Xanthobacter agilis]|uniref:Transporter n=1 Tax=Xanthobacter agilis TaxID=47492 RepID=A0ABU0L932_XANAG|nr:transporter [Xanthobacter agilis]MDQ0503597.1 hypothetical protein [Xanthobacter agilis]